MPIPLLPSRSRSCAMAALRPLLPAALLTTALAVAPLAGLASQQKQNQPKAVAPPTVLQVVRRLLGIPQQLAVGGSRSSSALSVCLVSPAPGRQVPVAAPTLLAAGELNELRLERNGLVIWQERASSTTPITGPVAWPVAPLQPGDTLQLRLRPRGASGADFATITLTAASADELRRHQALIEGLGSSTARWSAAIEQAASTNPALAIALLTSPLAPAEIRAGAAELGCQSADAP